ncbi:MAG: hypothetical protein ABIQ01_04915 [Pseudolysinimonas sp.]
MNTPDIITELEPGQVFVFGSNTEGIHAGGAAAVAHQNFGASWGQGEGLQGDSYAIPTMGSLDELGQAVARFLKFAATRPDLTFLVTKIGTGIAGHPTVLVARYFAARLDNVILPTEFETALAGARS